MTKQVLPKLQAAQTQLSWDRQLALLLIRSYFVLECLGSVLGSGSSFLLTQKVNKLKQLGLCHSRERPGLSFHFPVLASA